jgi:hypothetical protein
MILVPCFWAGVGTNGVRGSRHEVVEIDLRSAPRDSSKEDDEEVCSEDSTSLGD